MGHHTNTSGANSRVRSLNKPGLTSRKVLLWFGVLVGLAGNHPPLAGRVWPNSRLAGPDAFTFRNMAIALDDEKLAWKISMRGVS